jgi:hypothetical protein
MAFISLKHGKETNGRTRSSSSAKAADKQIETRSAINATALSEVKNRGSAAKFQEGNRKFSSAGSHPRRCEIRT